MKKLFTLICMALFISTASAQITWNAKAGLGLAKCVADGMSTDNKFVAKAGVGIEKAFTPNWSIMPSLEIAMKGFEYNFEDDRFTQNVETSIYYLQIPVLAAYRLNLNDSWNLAVKAGPYIAYGISGKIKEEFQDHWGTPGNEYKEESDLFDVAERLDYGLIFAVDFEYHQYVFGVEYEMGLANMSKSDEGEIKNSAWYVTVGYKF